MKNALEILLLFLAIIYGCNSNRLKNRLKINFSCKEIYVDTTDDSGPGFAFKILIKNPTKSNFYIIANGDDLNYGDSLYSSFFLVDSTLGLKSKLSLFSSINPLHSHTTLILGVIGEIYIGDIIKNNTIKIRVSRQVLVTSLLRKCKLLYVCDKRDFYNEKINTKYLVRDTTIIQFSKSTITHFDKVYVNDFINDSLYMAEHPKRYFLFK